MLCLYRSGSLTLSMMQNVSPKEITCARPSLLCVRNCKRLTFSSATPSSIAGCIQREQRLDPGAIFGHTQHTRSTITNETPLSLLRTRQFSGLNSCTAPHQPSCGEFRSANTESMQSFLVIQHPTSPNTDTEIIGLYEQWLALILLLVAPK